MCGDRGVGSDGHSEFDARYARSAMKAVLSERTRAARMSGTARRRQLLEVAARLVAENGPDAITMERLATVAEVSKALPYKHFPNAEGVLVAVYQRAGRALGGHVWNAIERAPADADLVDVWIAAHFRHGHHEPLFAALHTPGSPVPGLADPGQSGEAFVASVLRHHFAVPATASHDVAGPILGSILAASFRWLREPASRPELERLTAAMLRAAITAAGGRP